MPVTYTSDSFGMGEQNVGGHCGLYVLIIVTGTCGSQGHIDDGSCSCSLLVLCQQNICDPVRAQIQCAALIAPTRFWDTLSAQSQLCQQAWTLS